MLEFLLKPDGASPQGAVGDADAGAGVAPTSASPTRRATFGPKCGLSSGSARRGRRGGCLVRGRVRRPWRLRWFLLRHGSGLRRGAVQRPFVAAPWPAAALASAYGRGCGVRRYPSRRRERREPSGRRAGRPAAVSVCRTWARRQASEMRSSGGIAGGGV